MRERVTSLVEVVGAGCVIVGAAQVAAPAGWVVAGMFLIVGGWLVAR